MPQGVRADALGDASVTHDAAHDPGGAVAIKARSVAADEDRSLGAFTDDEVDRSSSSRCERDDHGLATLAQHQQGSMPTFEAELFDVGTDRF